MLKNLHVSLTSFCNESRVLKETDTLVQSGLVDLVFIAALHEEGLKEHEIVDDKRELWRVKLKSRALPKNLFSQLIKYVEYCIRVAFFAKKKDIKLINIHSLSLLPLGYLIKLITGSKLVYDAHELETEQGEKGIRKKLSKLTERFFIQRVDLTIVVSDAIKAWYKLHYNGVPIATVLNCPVFKYPEYSNKLREELTVPDNRKIILYQGVLAAGRGIDFLLSAFCSNSQSDYALVFMGYGELEDKIKEASHRNVAIYYMPAVPPDVVMEYTSSADIGLSLIENTNLSYKYCLPNKLFEYMIAHIPVIVSDMPEMKRVVNDFNVGRVIEKMDEKTLFSAFRNVLLMPKKELRNDLNKAAKRFNWEGQGVKMINAYKKYIF